jgi:hypothetical protein
MDIEKLSEHIKPLIEYLMTFFANPLTWVIIVFMIFVLMRLKIIKENERFAIHILGQFKGLKGPGLLIKFAGKEAKWTLIKADDRGKVVTDNMFRIKEKDIPFKSADKVRPGSFVRISGFENEHVIVVKDMDQRNTFICEKCGHQNIIR